MEVYDLKISKKSRDETLNLPPLNDSGIHEGATPVISAHGQQPQPDRVRHFVHPKMGLLDARTDEHRPGSPVGRGDVVVCKRDENKRLTCFRVFQADTAGEAGLGIGGAAFAPALR